MLAGERGWASEREALLAYHDPLLQPLIARLQSELTSDGYVVRVELSAAPLICESVAGGSATPSPNQEQVWVRVVPSPSAPSTGCAAITYWGVGAEARYTRVTASSSDPKRFAILVAEALNGLSTRPLPPGAPGRESATVMVPQAAPPAQSRSAVGAWSTLLLDATHPEPLFGVGLLGELPLSEALALHIDSFGTVTRLELEEADTSVRARFAWTRLSLALQLSRGPANLKLTAGAGPALSWASADVPPPDVARADVGASVLFAVGSTFTYPSNQPVQLGIALRASTLVPSVRLELPSGPSAPFGRLLGEASIGLVIAP